MIGTHIPVMANNTTLSKVSKCLSGYSGKIFITDNQRYFLIAFDLLLLILNFMANSGVVIALVMAKFMRNTSLILLFLLSISDIFLALITQTLFAILIAGYADQTYCTFEMIVQFFAIFLTHTSGYTIACIGFDRYARMRYLNRYSVVVTRRRVFTASFIIYLLSFFQGLLYVLGTKFDVFEKAKQVGLGIDFVIALFVVGIYLLTIKVVKDHRNNSKNRNFLANVDRKIAQLSAKILLAVLILYGAYIVISVCHIILDKKLKGNAKAWLNFAVHFGYVLTYCNSFANAVLFLTMNKEAKPNILQFFHVNKVADSSSGSNPSSQSSKFINAYNSS